VISQKLVVCSKCQYAQNLSTARNCEFCGASLRKQDVVIAATLLGLGGLGLIGAGTFFLKDHLPVASPNQSLIHRSNGSGQPLLKSVSSSLYPGAGGGQLAPTQIYKRIADVPDVPQGAFTYGGSTTFAPLRSPKIIQKITQAFPQFQLRYVEPTMGQPGSGKGIQMLLQSQLSFAQSSRGLKNTEIAQANNRGYALEEIPVALDGIAFYINPKLPNRGLKGLTLTQIQNIFTGKIRNWKDLGGLDVKIVPFSRNLKAGGTTDFLYESVLEHQPFGSNVKEVRDTTESIRSVAGHLGGIGYASASEILGQQSIRSFRISKKGTQNYVSPCGNAACTTINASAFMDGSYPVTRRLLIIVKRDSKRDKQAGLAYANILLSDEGQKLINQAGFVSLR
jgi:phosphate transport system substrate-binding protein